MNLREIFGDVLDDLANWWLGPPTWCVVSDPSAEPEDALRAVPEEDYEPENDVLIARDLRLHEARRLIDRLRSCIDAAADR